MAEMRTKAKYPGGSFLLQSPDVADVVTPDELTQEQRMIRDTARDFSEKVRGRLHEIEQDKRGTSRPLLQELGELGLLSLDVPEEYGGVGLDKITSTVVTDEFGRAGAFAVTIGAHAGIGTLPIVYFGTHEQKARYLPRLATGEWVAAYALTEPGSGSDAQGARTTARLSEDGQHWILNGTKQWITNSAFADLFVVYAKVDGEQFSAFIVERSFPGVSVGPEEQKMGLHASSTCTLILEDVHVPVGNLLGEIGRGHVIAFNILNIGRFKLGAGIIGTTKYLMEVSSRYAKTRKQFGRAIAEFRAIQQKLADMNIRTYVNESMIYRTGGLIEVNLAGLASQRDQRGREAARRIAEYAVECSINKVFGSETLDFVADEAVQIHGGYGFMREYEVCTAYLDSRINRIFEGTNEINRLLIPDTLMRRAMKGELPLMAAMMKLQDELTDLAPFEESDEPLALAWHMIDRTRKLFLMLAGLGVQKYQAALEHEQELLMGVAEIAIAVYAMESVLLRASKAIGRGAPGLQVEMAQIYCQEAFERVGMIARQMLPTLEEEGDLLRVQLGLVRRLTRYQPVDVVGRKRRVAAAVLEREGYAL